MLHFLGMGGSFKQKSSHRLHQDGHDFSWPFTTESLLGGRGCSEYNSLWNTEGGFGGGGGGCTAGGGGGGFNGE